MKEHKEYKGLWEFPVVGMGIPVKNRFLYWVGIGLEVILLGLPYWLIYIPLDFLNKLSKKLKEAQSDEY